MNYAAAAALLLASTPAAVRAAPGLRSGAAAGFFELAAPDLRAGAATADPRCTQGKGCGGCLVVGNRCDYTPEFEGDACTGANSEGQERVDCSATTAPPPPPPATTLTCDDCTPGQCLVYPMNQCIGVGFRGMDEAALLGACVEAGFAFCVDPDAAEEPEPEAATTTTTTAPEPEPEPEPEAAYALALLNADSCPALSSAITTLDECQLATSNIGYSWRHNGDRAWDDCPTGCFCIEVSGNNPNWKKCYWNTNDTGPGRFDVQPLCAQDPAAAEDPTSPEAVM